MPTEADLIHQTFDSSPRVLDNRNISSIYGGWSEPTQISMPIA